MNDKTQTTGHALKKQGMDTVADHNPQILEWVLLFIGNCQKGHLRTANHDRVFTIEELVRIFESLYRAPKVPTSLNGAIGSQARKRGYVEETGKWLEADREVRHKNRVPELRWALY